MTTHARARGTSLAVRLLALVVVPLVALAFLASARIRNELGAVDDATRLAETVELQHAVASVYPLAQVEQIALEGLALLDELALPRGIVGAFTGLDLEGMAEDNHAELDRSLDELSERFGDVELSTGERLDGRLSRIRSDIDVHRDRSERRIGGGDIDSTFVALDVVLSDVIDQLQTSRSDNTPDGPRIQLDLLAEVVVSAGENAQVQLQTVLYQTDELRTTSQRLGAAHEALLGAYEGALDPDERAELGPVRDLAEALPVPTMRPAGSASSLDPAVIADSADDALAHFDYITRLAEYSSEFHEKAVAQAEDEAASARADVRRTAWLLVAIALVTTILISYVLWSTVAPIRKLTQRAESISRGNLDHADLAVSGPRDLRALITTTNEMVGTLNQMQHEVGRLASGHVTTDATPTLPGAIGISMRESVARLATVTAQLKNSEQFASAIVAQAADAIWTVDADGRIRSANAASVQLTGRLADDQIGRQLSAFLSATRGEATVVTTDGPVIPVLAVDSAVDVGDERVTIVIAHDISERARYEARLAYQANHDALTGLPNRFSLLAQIDRCLASSDRVAVLFVDLDGFKNINDTKGHAVGDEVLTAVAERLRECVGSDDLVGRLGGDEFVIVTPLLPDVDDVIAFGEWVIRSIERPHRIDGETFSLSASTGIALPQPGANALDVLRQADNAVYQAKRRGRGRVELFDAGMQARVEHEAELELALRQAVRSGQLSVDLQPVLDLQTGKIVSAEALARWTRPGIGPVSPADFIPIAERSSLIFEVERWVLRRVCEQLVDWRARDPRCSTRIAVNISGRHLVDGDLIADVDEALMVTGADPTMLELELTETQLLEDHERATEVLEALRRRGITIAVDDFGTGYSSLTYLRHLPIDAVKIDRSFVARVTENGHDSTIIEALLTISRSLDLTVVAEGVETSGQLDYLKAHGCDRAQGYLIARPAPPAAAEPLILDLDDAVV